MADFRQVRAFLDWLVRTEQKPADYVFKTQREALDFVRRVYNENGANTQLRSVYDHYREVKTRGLVVRPRVGKPLRKAV